MLATRSQGDPAFCQKKRKLFSLRGNRGRSRREINSTLQDSEPARATNAISDVFLVNPLQKHGTREESRGREESGGPEKPIFQDGGQHDL